MTPEVLSVDPEMGVAEVATIMATIGVSGVPVGEKRGAFGVISKRDFFEAYGVNGMPEFHECGGKVSYSKESLY